MDDKTINRNYGIDVIAGILIIWMVTSHYLTFFGVQKDDYSATRFLQNALYFFMPWFYFKSGMFYRRETKTNMLRKTSKNLLRPFILYSIYGTAIGMIAFLVKGENPIYLIISELYFLIHWGSTEWNAALWFLLSLFVVRNIHNAFCNHTKILCAISFILSIAHYYIIDHSLWYIGGNILTGMWFYDLGVCLRDKQYSKSLAIISSVFYAVSVFVYNSKLSMFNNDLLGSGYYMLSLIYPVFANISANNIARTFAQNYLTNALAWIGNHSMIIYVLHYPIGKFVCSMLNFL